MSFLRSLRNIEWLTLLPLLYLLALGLLIQYAIRYKTKGVTIDFTPLTQLVAIGLGVAGMIVIARLHPRNWQRLGWGLYAISIVLLIAVLFVGNGDDVQRWLEIGSLQIQPSEIAKIGLILVLAHTFAKSERALNRLRTLAYSVAVTALPAVLVALEPDLGTAVVYGVVWFGMLVLSNMKNRYIFVVFSATFLLILLLLPSLTQYQQERIDVFLDPSSDTQNTGYNIAQASIAIGSGGLLGNGLDSGSQSQLNFLPSQHTDFIFAVVGEKLGLLGALSIILSILLIVFRTTFIASQTDTLFVRNVVIGFTILLFTHSLINIGMNLGLVPVTGLPLPLVSFGGTFVMVTLWGFGFVLRAAHNLKTAQNGLVTSR